MKVSVGAAAAPADISPQFPFTSIAPGGARLEVGGVAVLRTED